ncbi:MAG: hypothetical protein LIO99_04455 [Clostridiales bacterium]|nr:hypothetical protein [Clostridiales bacterium]
MRKNLLVNLLCGTFIICTPLVASASDVDLMSHADFVEAELDTQVTVETYVQAKQSWWEGTATIYTQAEDGAYFLYNMDCSEEEYDLLEVGTKIRVTGYKSEWSGEVEIIDSTFEFVDDGETYVAEPYDSTELLGTDELIEHQNEFVSFSQMVVEASEDPDGNDVSFLYSWDGSGESGDDLYFNVSYNGAIYNFVVESYLCDPTTEVYKDVESLNIGDTVNLEGFLYWYEGANPHITSVEVVTGEEVIADTSMENQEGDLDGDEEQDIEETEDFETEEVIETEEAVETEEAAETEEAIETEEAETEYSGPVFKTFYWGDSKETVIEAEGEPALTGDMTSYDAEYIAYETTVAGLDSILAYYFCDDGLYLVRYILTEEHSTESLYIDDYDKLVSGITSKYGEPLLNYDDWESDSKKEYYSGNEGKALEYGYLKKTAYWYLDDTFIAVTASADNYDVSTEVQYESLTISPGEADYSSDF